MPNSISVIGKRVHGNDIFGVIIMDGIKGAKLPLNGFLIAHEVGSLDIKFGIWQLGDEIYLSTVCLADINFITAGD